MIRRVTISYLWSHVGLYMMHIGYDVTCITNHDKIEELDLGNKVGAVYECKDSIDFSFREKAMFPKNVEENQLALANEVALLIIMRQGTFKPLANPLAQILPLF